MFQDKTIEEIRGILTDKPLTVEELAFLICTYEKTLALYARHFEKLQVIGVQATYKKKRRPWKTLSDLACDIHGLPRRPGAPTKAPKPKPYKSGKPGPPDGLPRFYREWLADKVSCEKARRPLVKLVVIAHEILLKDGYIRHPIDQLNNSEKKLLKSVQKSLPRYRRLADEIRTRWEQEDRENLS